MPRHCPECKAEMEDDGVHAWCVAAGCGFKGYVVVKTGKHLREPQSKPRKCFHCGSEDAPHDSWGGPMCDDCMSACADF